MRTLSLKLIILFIVLVPLFGTAQNMKISGTVFDSTGLAPLKNSVIMAVRIQDSFQSKIRLKKSILNCIFQIQLDCTLGLQMKF